MARRSTQVAGAKRRKGAGHVTLADVARLAGVTTMSVSRALRMPSEVSPELRQRVQHAIEQLGYVRNRVAGGLAGAASDVVGVIVPSMHNAFFSATLEALARELESRGVGLLVGNSGYDARKESDLAYALLSWRPRALVLTGVHHSAKVLRLMRGVSTPLIEMWDLSSRPATLNIGFSHRDAGVAVARHFASAGYRKLAFAGANMRLDRRARQRCAGFVAEALRLGLQRPRVVEIEQRAEVGCGREAAAELLRGTPAVQAAAFSNDVLALGALFECQARGIAVPDRLALAGFGDLDVVAQAVPAITSVAPPSAEIGRLVGQAVFDEQLRRRRTIDLGFHLITRASSAPRR